ncbi:hypothetical protein PanWU01x14_037000 [Parasponia andersonii]|uniref:Uncharacterized protein n=1 Tax=Parasponia andersonii TaxID=3476 RepID=A0A2P5DSN4_PARAD|nr:hypothetical protein PanWU01x14_037000 [Parasponia andersonii]
MKKKKSAPRGKSGLVPSRRRIIARKLGNDNSNQQAKYFANTSTSKMGTNEPMEECCNLNNEEERLRSIWWGSLSFCDGKYDKVDGYAACKLTKASPEFLKFAYSFPGLLAAEVLSRLDVWPNCFRTKDKYYMWAVVVGANVFFPLKKECSTPICISESEVPPNSANDVDAAVRDESRSSKNWVAQEILTKNCVRHHLNGHIRSEEQSTKAFLREFPQPLQMVFLAPNFLLITSLKRQEHCELARPNKTFRECLNN